MSARAAQKVGRSVTSSTMWPTQRKQMTADSLPAMRVTAGLWMRRSFWQSGSTLPLKLLRQGIQDEQTIDRLESYTLRIEQYVEAMSSVQKLEQLSVKPKEIRLSVLQSELQETARLLALSKKVSVLVPSGGTVCIDHGLFLTVAENLIGNAARFAEKAISIQITLQNDSLVLKVEDDGAGYPLSLVQNGPNPFETTSSNSSHFGMGLYSSRILCEKHGGRLILGNQAGGGASATAIFHFV